MKDKCRKMFSYFQKLNRQILIVIYCRIQCYNESYVRLATNCKDIKLRNGPNQNILMILSCQLGGYALQKSALPFCKSASTDQLNESHLFPFFDRLRAHLIIVYYQ